jgi:hypothetical protein
MSHTPGPWTGWYTPTGPDEHGWAIGPEGCTPCVATVSADEAGGLTDGASIEANARLIAAAPDLLAALIALKDHVAGEMTFTDDGAGWQPDDLPLAQLLTTAEDAITKAEGEPK